MTVETIKGYIPLNWPLLLNPVNWVIVFLMLALAGVSLALIAQASQTDTQSNIVEE